MREARPGRMRRSVGLMAVGALLLTACGGPLQSTPAENGSSAELTAAQQVYAKFNAMSGQARTDALVAAAQQEGTVTLYGSTSTGDIAKGYEKKYGIKVKLYEADSETAVTRLLQEAAAGRNTADYFDGAEDLLQTLQSKGLLGDYESPLRSAIPGEGRGQDWTGYRRQAFVAAYNTKLLPPSQVPKSYADFADPKWKGKISMEIGDYDWFMGLSTYFKQQGMSDAQVTDLFDRIAANAKVVKGHSNQRDLLAAGQFAVSLSAFVHHTDGLAAKGAPVAWGGTGKPTVQPVVVRYEGAAIMRHAPHPAAAMLFLDYLLGPDGVAALHDEHMLPAAPGPNDPLEGVQTVRLDIGAFTRDSKQWSAAYDAVLRRAKS